MHIFSKPLKYSVFLVLTSLSGQLAVAQTIQLVEVRCEALAYLETRRIPDQSLGQYDENPTGAGKPSFYASCDVAILRTVMGEDLQQTLTPEKRKAWIDHINSFASPDGTYGPWRQGICREFTHGMAVAALSVLGGKEKHAAWFFDYVDTPAKIRPWLETIDWRWQSGGTQRVWAPILGFSMSSRCTSEWRDAAFTWLDDNLDPKTGWWRKGISPATPLDPLGGAYVWPMYQHHDRPFPYPTRVIDSILALQKPDRSWNRYGDSSELNALYGLRYMASLAPNHRHDEVLKAAERHGRGLVEQWPALLAAKPDPHELLAIVSTFGVLQQLLPDLFVDECEGLRVCRQPAREIARLYDKVAVAHDHLTLNPGDNPLGDLKGDLFDIELVAELGQAKSIELNVRGERIAYDPGTGRLQCGSKSAPLKLADGRLKLRVLVDSASIEVYADKGQVSISHGFLPKPDNRSYALQTQGAPLKLESLRVRSLRSAWRPDGSGN